MRKTTAIKQGNFTAIKDISPPEPYNYIKEKLYNTNGYNNIILSHPETHIVVLK